MPTERTHEYRITSRWTGNLGSGTSAYAADSRAHECSGEGKSAPILGSSDPAFRGDPARYNPEEQQHGVHPRAVSGFRRVRDSEPP